MQDLEGKIALITGSSRGIGRAIARSLAAKGCKVVINYLSDHASADELVAELKSKGAHAITIQAHLGDTDSRADLWKKFDSHFPHLDFFIANAATGVFRESSSLTLKSIRKVFAVNFEAFFEMGHEAVKRMPQKPGPGDRGRIIALSSIGAERAIENYGSIAASKAAMESMLRQMARELGPKGVNCNTVRAGLVDTGILSFVQGKEKIISDTIAHTPNGRLVTPEEVADLVTFLVSSESRMINGQTLMVDGGYSVLA